ncbi:MAG: NrfD/PsrC family molybdoenzyme membrane anchor subunit [bacterium]|nr:NrfD/PsrC family molybdoenzyme membrane anchor subunit [bacterium]
MELIFNIQGMPVWDWRVALDLFFGGIGVGAFLVALLVDWFYRDQQSLGRTAASLSPAMLLLGFLFLLMKLGRPMASIHLFTTYQPQSAVWWGGWLQSALLAGVLVYAFLWGQEASAFRRLWGLLVAPLAVAVAAYHGLLLASFRVRSLWVSTPALLSALFAAIATGLALTLLVHIVRARSQGQLQGAELVDYWRELSGLRKLLGAVLILQLLVLAYWWLRLSGGGDAAVQALSAATAAYGLVFWGGGLGLGLVLPLLIGLNLARQAEASGEMVWTGLWTGSASILLGGLALRWAVVLGGQSAPLSMILG